MKNSIFILTLCLSAYSFGASFSVDHRIPLSGSDGWDYLAVDTASDRLFVTRGNHVDVLDLKTEKVVGTISQAIDGAHGVAFAAALKKGYITSGKSEKVVVFDLASLKVIKEIPAGKKADAIVFDELTARVFAFNGEDATVTVIDAKTDVVLKTIKLEGKPEFAVANQGLVYFNNEDKNSVLVIDAKEMQVKFNWALQDCQSPTGLAADFLNKRLFSVCKNEIMAVTDIESGKNIKNVKIGKSPDATVFDDGLVFSSNGEGTVSVIQEKTLTEFAPFQTVKTQKGARTMAVDPKTHNAYLIAAQYEAVDPKASAKNPKTRPKIVPGTVELLVIKKH